MSDSIMDNQEITTEILNDIAIDLGATSFNGFGEEKFGADELNSITSALVHGGILNSGNKCIPSISSGNVIISDGIIVFASGVKKKITEAVSVPLEAKTYIYALNDTVTNTCSIIVSATEPTSGDYIMVAEVDSNKVLTDKRRMATSKVVFATTPGAIQSETKRIDFNGGQHLSYVFNMGTDLFTYVLLPTGYNGNHYIDVSGGAESPPINISNYGTLTFKKEGASVVVKTAFNGSGGHSHELSFMVI